ncbi:MotA/TolQ/ExbB proton channel family protein [Leptolyngbyaceae cyanobacterium CCMR0082]|uniref:MotA/TolQ/ExbB proton channel family protein n=2 Tax=Adonisia turfae TaxID=2950184 RepID=A0A6M0S875_9CYAN|nr:MotA/TolQ/ExbB proton channel family protein [Adonisia turfae]MDV3348973.1 MotA/TolQ/ExbB proton channel family protein [Leptothoe sp. LEGE 181152]NEZ56886.1 MotA/TolQ/ExbB proton channel family protein [Adonisia turfae CCMR0081]NEZ64590.1 MotA/TolQ/ExbB proton channel family protein [Adonisia turfae CCMR0082]
MSLTEIFQAGGIVMWPLALFSLIAIALSVERLVFWIRINRSQRKVVKQVLATYRRTPMDVFTLLRQNIHLPISRIFLEALELEKPSPSQFRLALESATQAELPILKRFNTVFQTIITVSPLLGLLGTILGLINSFGAIEIGGIGTNANAVTSGISEALVSTATGMVVAIFTLLFANLFRGLYKRQISLLQEHGGQLELLYENHYTNKLGSQEYAHP